MSRDEINDLDQDESPGVGTDGSLTSHHHHHHDAEHHVGVGTDGSLHSHHEDEVEDVEDVVDKDDDPRR